MSRTTNLYHVTSYDKAVRILDDKAIIPEKSQGKRVVCWYVSKSMVPWAIAHIANRHALPIEDIAILHVRADVDTISKTNKRGVYCSAWKQRPTEMDSAAMWLSRQEKYMAIRGSTFKGRKRADRDRENAEDMS